MLTALVAVILSGFTGCRVGEGDPLLSFRSREARVTGDWTVQRWSEESISSEENSSSGQTTSTSTTSTTMISEEHLTTSSTSTGVNPSGTSTTTSTGNGRASASFTFSDDGTFSKTFAYRDHVRTFTSGSITSATTVNDVITETGTWNFLGDIDEDYADQERMILTILKKTVVGDYVSASGLTFNYIETFTYSNGESTEIWQITTLRNNEMILEAERTSVGTYQEDYSVQGMTGTNSGTSREESSISATLIQE